MFLYLVQRLDAVAGLIPYLAADSQSFPVASMAPMNLFFVGVSCWMRVVLLTAIVIVKSTGLDGN